MGAVSPLVLDAFEQELLAYPDPAIRDYILSGIAHGFHVGYSNSGKLLRSSNRNLKSASLHKEVIDKYLAKEVALNRVAGPFPIPPIHGLHISPFGVIPKRGQPGQWRLILDLSSPHGYTVSVLVVYIGPRGVSIGHSLKTLKFGLPVLKTWPKAGVQESK